MMAWDEQTSAAMYARYANSRYGLMGGVIWATDRLQAGEQRARLRVLRHILSRLDMVWALSRAQLPVLREWLDLPESRIQFVPFGIDTDFYPQHPLPNRPTVLSLGNDRDRDPTTLLTALRQVKEALPDTRIVVQAPGNLRLPEGFDSLDRLTGPQVRALYAEASLVAIATRPNLHVSGMTTALEAMSTGRPVVLSATGGVEDYLLDGETGRLVRPGAPGDMATAVIELLTNQSEMQRMSSAAAAYVRKEHTQRTMAAAFAEIAFQTLSGRHEDASSDTRNRHWARHLGSPVRQRVGGAG
ncbi:glycosyltransferase family 4 protein [Arthrobacter sp. NPDC089319]|uniref:glycosyltransferase family 4 protein n=1 Tax=Arthrobacter sp. NPDC089319 TaxID=3155915 RepID=UPI00341BDE7E